MVAGAGGRASVTSASRPPAAGRGAGEGADANAMMPVLAAHVGHADTRRAGCCLRPAAETCPGMVAQVERECGWVVPS